ncbi:hypothetical protein CASFOL_042135 [Castilleja foliolosa]|uniref:Uncharacterized protein n=1 Tax=Castilleja foliolosa TaxID=1961234 RepID=A0ABD3B9M2_9LAMI
MKVENPNIPNPNFKTELCNLPPPSDDGKSYIQQRKIPTPADDTTSNWTIPNSRQPQRPPTFLRNPPDPNSKPISPPPGFHNFARTTDAVMTEITNDELAGEASRSGAETEIESPKTETAVTINQTSPIGQST